MLPKEIIILAIESSCDDTSAAVLKNETILSNVIAGQKIHAQYGGVVPEIASRAHQQNIVPVVEAAMREAGIKREDITALAFTKGPGLLGSLIVGTAFAKSFAFALNLPLLAVNHMKGHILAHFIQDGSPCPSFPFLCLTVSGGHTQIVLVKSHAEMQLVGTTIDDAAGEAFDKTAKLLGLPYPGGPLIDKYAQLGDEKKFSFTHPKIAGFDYSFSGLKTNVLQSLQKNEKANSNFIAENRDDICASVQKTIVDILLEKLEQASEHFGIREIAIAGGVSANSTLRKEIEKRGQKYGWNTYIPQFQYCTDNAAMIAIAGYYQFLAGDFSDQSVSPMARMPME